MEFLHDIFEYRYLANAVAACLLSGITCGIAGTYVVARRTVSLCGGITHASFGGLGIALYFGFNPILGALVFAVLSALGIEAVSSRAKIREDSAIGIMWGIGMATGALFMSLRPGYASGDLSSFLFGNIIAVTDGDVAALGVVASLLLVGALLWMRQVMYVAFDRDFARSAGIPTQMVSCAMAVITAVVIVLSIRIMGIVLLISLLTIPVVTVGFLTQSYGRVAVWSSVAAAAAGLCGLAVSYRFEIPSGPAIIFVLATAMAAVKFVVKPLLARLTAERGRQCSAEVR